MKRAATTHRIFNACLPLALALALSSCGGNGGGGSGLGGTGNMGDIIGAGNGGGDERSAAAPAIEGGIFDADTYAAISASDNLSGLWMAVYVSTRSEGNVVNGAFDAVRREYLMRRELVTIDDAAEGSTITYCGAPPVTLQAADASVSHGLIQPSRYNGQQVTLTVEANGSLQMIRDSGVIDSGNAGVVQYYQQVQVIEDLTLVRIASDVPVGGIGSLQLSWLQAEPENDSGSSTEAVNCFAEYRKIVTVPGVIENDFERFLLGTEYARSVLFVDGISHEWAFAQKVTAEGEPITQEAARDSKADFYPSTSIWWTSDETLVDGDAMQNYCFALGACPLMTLTTSELAQATTAEIDALTNAPTPLFVRQSHTSTTNTIGLTVTTSDDDNNNLDASVDITW